jgi:hypothetical protein
MKKVKKEKPYPKYMMVGDLEGQLDNKKFVLCYYDNCYWAIRKQWNLRSGGDIVPWKYAKDIDESAEQIETIEKQIAELTTKLNELKSIQHE